jgi:hypothetical protein
MFVITCLEKDKRCAYQGKRSSGASEVGPIIDSLYPFASELIEPTGSAQQQQDEHDDHHGDEDVAQAGAHFVSMLKTARRRPLPRSGVRLAAEACSCKGAFSSERASRELGGLRSTNRIDQAAEASP